VTKGAAHMVLYHRKWPSFIAKQFFFLRTDDPFGQLNWVKEECCYDNMGRQSQGCNLGTKAMKAKKGRSNHAFGNVSDETRKAIVKKIAETQGRAVQHKVSGGRSYSVVAGTKVCKYCVAIERGKESKYKKGHDVTCPKSTKFNKSVTSIAVNKAVKRYQKINNAPATSNRIIDKSFFAPCLLEKAST